MVTEIYKGTVILRDLDTNFKWWCWCCVVDGRMMEYMSGRKTLGADTREGRQTADGERQK